MRKLLWSGPYAGIGAAATIDHEEMSAVDTSADKVKAASGRLTSESGPIPFIVVGVALAAGVALGKWIDWRGRAHPRW